MGRKLHKAEIPSHPGRHVSLPHSSTHITFLAERALLFVFIGKKQVIDDSEKFGAWQFEGQLILFGSERFGGWGGISCLNTKAPSGANKLW